MKIKRSKEWWAALAKEADLPIGAGQLSTRPTDLAVRELLRMAKVFEARAVKALRYSEYISASDIERAAKSCRLRAARLKKGKVIK